MRNVDRYRLRSLSARIPFAALTLLIGTAPCACAKSEAENEDLHASNEETTQNSVAETTDPITLLGKDDVAWVKEHGPALTKSIKSSIDDPDLDDLVGIAMMSSQDDAIEVLSVAVEEHPDSAFAHWLLATAYQGDWSGVLFGKPRDIDLDKAREHFEIASSLEPENALHDVFLMMNLERAGNHAEATEVLLSLPRKTQYEFNPWRLQLAREHALRSSGLYDPDVARKLFSAESMLTLHRANDSATRELPVSADGLEISDIEHLEAVANASVHLGRLLSTSGGVLELGIGAVTIKIVGIRMQPAYEALGRDDDAAIAAAWTEEGKDLREQLVANMSAGHYTWWHLHLRDLQDSYEAGNLDQESYEKAKAPLEQALSEYFPDHNPSR